MLTNIFFLTRICFIQQNFFYKNFWLTKNFFYQHFFSPGSIWHTGKFVLIRTNPYVRPNRTIFFRQNLGFDDAVHFVPITLYLHPLPLHLCHCTRSQGEPCPLGDWCSGHDRFGAWVKVIQGALEIGTN